MTWKWLNLVPPSFAFPLPGFLVWRILQNPPWTHFHVHFLPSVLLVPNGHTIIMPWVHMSTAPGVKLSYWLWARLSFQSVVSGPLTGLWFSQLLWRVLQFVDDTYRVVCVTFGMALGSSTSHCTLQGEGESEVEIGTETGLLEEGNLELSVQLEAFIPPLSRTQSLGWRSPTVTEPSVKGKRCY